MSRSSFEKDLRELERLLKAAQQSGGAVPNGDAGAGGGGGTSTIRQQLRSVLRKLMEAYFNPLHGESVACMCEELCVPRVPRGRASRALPAMTSSMHAPISPSTVRIDVRTGEVKIFRV